MEIRTSGRGTDDPVRSRVSVSLTPSVQRVVARKALEMRTSGSDRDGRFHSRVSLPRRACADSTGPGYRDHVGDNGREFSRRDLAGWLEGPKASLEDQGFEFGYKGQRLGLPESGPGAVAGVGRRFLALTIDWLACVLIANLVSSGQPPAFLPLVIFFVEVALLTALTGSSFGQRIVGIRVVSLTRGRLDPARAALRTLLLCLVVPPLVFDRDQRGLHDKAANSVAVRMGRPQPDA